MKSSTHRLGLTVALLLLAVCACTREEFPYRYRFRYAHSQPARHPRSQSMVFFEQELERRTGGRIQVENYFSGLLGNERELMDLVATGVLEGTRGGHYADANRKYSLMELPFLVDDWDQALRLIASDFMARINYQARRNGFHVPACGISQGFRAHTNNVRPLRTPDDLEGLKMRVPPQETYIVTARAFGANPQEMPFLETYQAAKTGVIDGTDNAASNLWEMNFYEVQTYLSVINYSIGPDPLMVNLDWYEALPTSLQSVFNEVSRAAMRYSDQLNRTSEAEYLDRLSARLQTNYVTGEDRRAFQRKVQPVYEYFVDKGTFTWEEINEARRVARAGG